MVSSENAKKDPTYLLKQELKQKIGELNERADSLRDNSREVAYSAFELVQELVDTIKIFKANIENIIEKSKQNLGG